MSLTKRKCVFCGKPMIWSSNRKESESPVCSKKACVKSRR